MRVRLWPLAVYAIFIVFLSAVFYYGPHLLEFTLYHLIRLTSYN